MWYYTVEVKTECPSLNKKWTEEVWVRGSSTLDEMLVQIENALEAIDEQVKENKKLPKGVLLTTTVSVISRTPCQGSEGRAQQLATSLPCMTLNAVKDGQSSSNS